MPPSAAHQKADNASLGELLGDVTRDLSTLMRQE
ncbi:phage holin family protein, partial [Pseudarthrobacter phenanthrenivorans]